MNQHTCPSWLSFSLDTSLRKLFHDPEKILRELVIPGSTLLDIGCGPGYFSIPMAQLAGPDGTVIAADLQPKMLEKMLMRAARFGVSERIKAVQCSQDNIMVRDKVDFVLTFWMVHEVKDKEKFFRQIVSVMKKNSRYLLSEPKVHVTGSQYEKIINAASSAGLKPERECPISLSRSMLFTI